MRSGLAIAVLAGCSFSTRTPAIDDAEPGAGDGTSHDGAEVDAAPLGPWGAPQLIAELSDASADDDPTLTSDLLEIYFNTTRSDPDGDIWYATRESPTGAWSAPMPLAAANSPAKETTPELAGDGLTLWFASARAGGVGGDDVYVMTRPNRGAAWSAPALVTELDTADTENGSAVWPGGLVMTLARTPGGGAYDLYMTTRGATAEAWAAPVPITELNTTVDDECPYSPDGMYVLYYSSQSAGTNDLYRVTRTDAASPFGTPVAITELNTSLRDIDPWVSADERYIVFMRGDDLYEARR